MQWLLKYILKIKPNFEEGQKLHWLYPVYEATETILFSTDEKTKSAPHIRDSIDIKRVMILVVITLIPCYIFGGINAHVTRKPSEISCFLTMANNISQNAPAIKVTAIIGTIVIAPKMRLPINDRSIPRAIAFW